MADLTGQTFAGFEIVAKLGEGGMGAVYKARQPLLDRFVALKVMSQKLGDDTAYVARFIREAASAAKITHPNMVQVHTAGEQGGIYYIVMEFVEGESLRERLAHAGRLDPVQAIAVSLYVAQALQTAWNKAQIIHRDIKPDNIFLSKDGEVKVGDLGLAKSVGGGETEMTQSGMMMGSPHYISPEQARASKTTDFRTDIYSLGCTLYQLLTGKTPYQADEAMAVVFKHVTEPTPNILEVMPECPPDLAALVGRMMAKSPEERYASYEELIAELWRVSDVVQQALSAPTAPMPAVAGAGATLKPTVVKTGSLVPTVVQERESVIGNRRLVIGSAVAATTLLLLGLFLWSPWKGRTDEQGRREGAKPGSESRLQAESVSGQPATPKVFGLQAGTPNAASAQHSPAPSLQHSAALSLLGSVFTNSVGAEMVYIPPGEFMLGSTKEELAWALANGAPEEHVKCEGEAQSKATIKQGFWLGRTEVTVGQWKQFVSATGYMTDGEKKGESYGPPGASKPWAPKKGVSWRNPDFGFEIQNEQAVTCISWNDAKSFCDWLTERERKAGCLPAGLCVRLPMEAEWEYACRAGTQTRFWWGDSTEDGKGRLNWGGPDDGFEFVAPVDSYGTRGRNRFDLADMLGNVCEWCLDEYDATQAHQDLWMGKPGTRVLRGASFYYIPAFCRCAYRRGNDPSRSSSYSGFRVCYGVDVSGASRKAVSTSSAPTPKEVGILAPPETRVTALTTNPKVGEVYTLTVGSNVTMELMGIPPGEFMLGSTKEERAWAAGISKKAGDIKSEGDAPLQTRIKDGFWLGRTEVTVAQWKEFAALTGYTTDAEKAGEANYAWDLLDKIWRPHVKGVIWRNPNFDRNDGHPVTYVSWNDAMAFCEWLTLRERKAGRLAAIHVVRLPTEAEWEYACRAGTQTKFWWGDSEEDDRGRLNRQGMEDGFLFSSPADQYGKQGRNGFGLADMLGNVYEWCLDEYDPNQGHAELYKGNSAARVLRGGSFNHGVAQSRCAYRFSNPPSSSTGDFGFRVSVGVEVSRLSRESTSSLRPVATEGGIIAPPETRVSALTTTPKVGEVFTLNIGSNVTMELMGIPPGEFMMGSTKEEQAWALANGLKDEFGKLASEVQQKTIIEKGFWLARTELSVGQWKQFINATHYQTVAENQGYVAYAPRQDQPWGRVEGVSWRNPGFGAPLDDNHPVNCISWSDAMAFCAWLTEREQKAARLPANHFIRLPTEAEWEYACRAGSRSKFWWGESKEDGNGRLSWRTSALSLVSTKPVDSFGKHGRNRFGLADMLGNVYEWCLDEYDSKQAHGECFKGNPGVCVLRGGSFFNFPPFNRCAARQYYFANSANCSYGFRVCVGNDVSAARTSTSSTPSPVVAPKAGGILAPPETRVSALTTTPKVGEVYTLALGSNVTMELMGIPPGEFMLGSTKEEREWALQNRLKERDVKREGEVPRKAVIRQGFWMQRTEVTVGQWKQFAGETGHVTDAEKKGESFVPAGSGKRFAVMKGKSWRDPNFGFEMRDGHPVSCISWNDAVAFCEWLNKRASGTRCLPAGCQIRLPTETEWEYACRARTQTKFWWGDSKEDGERRLNWVGKDDGFELVAPVDSFGVRGRNRFGLADMLGNLYEWCLDEYDAAQAHEDVWKGNPDKRVLRGGSFFYDLGFHRCASSIGSAPTDSGCGIGFRVVVGPAR